MKRWLTISLLLLAALAAMPATAAAPLDPVYASTPAEWGPVPSGVQSADDQDQALKKGIDRQARSPDILLPTDSGWYQRADGNFYTEQCNILVDSVAAGYPGGCLYRLTLMCVQNGVGYVRGAGQQDSPFIAPVLLALYQPPSITPVGYTQINHLDAAPVIGLNAAPVPWVRTASYTGGECATAFDQK